MLNIDTIKDEIIAALLPLNPNKIILFGSYAYGTPNENSDVDLFLIKDNLKIEESRSYEIKAHKSLKNLIKKYKIAFDVLSAPTNYLKEREDYFYKVDILQNGKVIYE